MRKIIPIILLVFSTAIGACEEDGCPKGKCDNKGTLRDFTALEGCGWVIVGDNGIFYKTVSKWGWCGTGLTEEDLMSDPLYKFEWIDGKRVSFSFDKKSSEKTDCMSGKSVVITCISEICGNENEGPAL